MIEYLGKEVEVKIDRPLGTRHPEYNFYYSVNCGYIEGAKSEDGKEIDAYVLGEFEALTTYTGKVIGIIKRFNDVKDKLIVAKEINSYDKYQIKALTEFQERFFDVEIITLDYLRSSIRNTVRGVIRRNDSILVLEEEFKGKVYYYLPGGGIEFLESCTDALRREIKEELNLEVKNIREVHTISNIFEIDGINAHEITQIFEVVVEDEVNDIDVKKTFGDLMPSTVRWIKVMDLKDGSRDFYPKELLELL